MVFHPHKDKRRSGASASTGQAERKVIPLPQPSESPGALMKDAHRRHLRMDEPSPEAGRTTAAEKKIEEWRVIAAVLHGDVIEFRTLVKRYQGPIYHLMLRISHHPMTAEDLTQDAFARAYEKLGTFKKGNRFFSWLYTIAANIGRDYLRRKGLQKDIFSTQPFDAAVADPNQDDCARKPDCVMEVNQIGDALKELPGRYSETMLLYYREGMSVREIAKALKISIAAVKVRIYRGRKMLREKLGGNDETR